MIKAVDKADPAYCSTFIMTTDTDSYLSWSEDSMKDENKELKAANLEMLQYYEEMEKSTQEVWTDKVAEVKAKYDAYGLKVAYMDMTKVLGKYDMAKGEWSLGKPWLGHLWQLLIYCNVINFALSSKSSSLIIHTILFSRDNSP